MSSLYKIVSGFFLRPSKVLDPLKNALIVFLLLTIHSSAYSQPVVKSWVSSQDMKKKMVSETDLTFTPVDSFGKSTITVNDKVAFQTIIGLGSSFEHSTCYNIGLGRQK